MLKEMDPDLVISDEIRGDLLLEAAGLTHHEQLMVLTSTGNDTDFDKIAEALQKQHGKNHIAHGFTPSRSFGGNRGKGKGKRRPGRYRFQKRAYFAGNDDDDDYEYDDDYEDEEYQEEQPADPEYYEPDSYWETPQNTTSSTTTVNHTKIYRSTTTTTPRYRSRSTQRQQTTSASR